MKEFPLVFDATSKLTAKEAAYIFGGVAAIVGLAYLTKTLIDAFSKADNIPTADQQRASAEAFMRAARANGAKEVKSSWKTLLRQDLAPAQKVRILSPRRKKATKPISRSSFFGIQS